MADLAKPPSLSEAELAEQKFVRSAVELVRNRGPYAFNATHELETYQSLSSESKDALVAELAGAMDRASSVSFRWKGRLSNALYRVIALELQDCAAAPQWYDKPARSASLPSEETLARLLVIAPRLKERDVQSLLDSLEQTAMPGELIDRYKVLATNPERRAEVLAAMRARKDVHHELDVSVSEVQAIDEESALRKLAEKEMTA